MFFRIDTLITFLTGNHVDFVKKYIETANYLSLCLILQGKLNREYSIFVVEDHACTYYYGQN